MYGLAVLFYNKHHNNLSLSANVPSIIRRFTSSPNPSARVFLYKSIKFFGIWCADNHNEHHQNGQDLQMLQMMIINNMLRQHI